MSKTVYVECRTEEALASLLHVDDVRHKSGKSRVLKELERVKDSIGLIDEDPLGPQPPLIKKYHRERSCEEVGIKVLYRRAQGNKLVVLCPRLEEWILRAAKDSRIDPKDYGLSDSPDGFHEISRINVDKFKKFAEELIRIGNKRMKELGKLLKP